MVKRIFGVSVALLLISVCAFASSSNQTDWTLLPGGQVSWNGLSTGSLTGSGINVLTVLGFGTPDNNLGLLSIYGGSLSFKSGSYTGNGSNWSWGAGTMVLRGCIQGITTAADVACNSSNDNTVLFTDNFTSIYISSKGQLMLGGNAGKYSSALAAYFGVPVTFSNASTDFLSLGSKPGKGFRGTNVGGTFTEGARVSVAEDWSPSLTLGLFAFAVAAFGAACRLGLLRPVKF